MPLVLASRSQRRIDLLRQIGVRCSVDPADINEDSRPQESPRDYVVRLAREKAAAVLARHTDRVVLGADTTVVIDGQSLGKPDDEAHGVAMLQQLQDRWHEVLTAVALMSDSGIAQTVTCTRVKFRRVGQDEALAYWRTGEPKDKAGGYAIQGFAAMFIERIEGSYSGVVGLPLAETSAALRRLGVDDALTESAGRRQ